MKLSLLRLLPALFLCLVVLFPGCSRESSAPGDLPVVIAATVPLTGDAASYGENQKRGIELALSKVNGEQTKPLLKVVYKDSQLSPKEAVNALQQSILQDKAQVVFTVSTGEVMAQAPVCNEKKVVLLSPLASGDDITNAGPFVYRVSPTDSFQGKAIGEKILSMGLKRLGILWVNNSFGKGLAGKFRETLEKGGGTVVASEAANPDQVDLRTHLAKLRTSRPEGIFLILHPGQAVAALKQIKELGIQTRLFGADTFSTGEIYSAAKVEAQGVVFSLPAQPDSALFKQFSADYEKIHKSPADINAAAAFDAVMLVARAVRAGARTGDQIRQYFDKQEPYEGASGLIQWDANGDVISKKYAIYIVEGDGYKPMQ